MKILRKLFITIPVVIVVLLITIVIVVRLFADRAVKFGIEKGGSAVLPVAVKVGDADVRVLFGTLGLHDLVIENPAGYKNKNLLELKDGSVGLNIRSLLSDTVKIKHIKLDGTELVLEQKDLLNNNIKDILKALPKEEEIEKEPAAPGKKLHIDELVISNTTVKVKLLPIPGRVDTIPLKLGTITMTNLGSDNKLSIALLIRKILSALFEGIAEQGKGILPDDLVNELSGELKHLLGKGKDILLEGGDAGKKILEGVGDTGKKIGEGFKGLNPFKKKEDE
jgi:hypothetical protein